MQGMDDGVGPYRELQRKESGGKVRGGGGYHPRPPSEPPPEAVMSVNEEPTDIPKWVGTDNTIGTPRSVKKKRTWKEQGRTGH